MIKIKNSIYWLFIAFVGLISMWSCEEDNTSAELSVPTTAAPVPPMRNSSDVISLYSNVYTNETVDSWNNNKESSTAEEFFIQVEGDDIIRYDNLNLVGVEFSTSPIDISNMETFHIDIWTPNPINTDSEFKILLIDFGANAIFDGGDDSSHEITITNTSLSSESWISLDIPLSDFTELSSRANLAQMIFSGSLPNLYIDNVYFYGETITQSIIPENAAPVPTRSSDDVLSIYSDTYIDIADTDFNPDWGQTTSMTEITVEGNNTLSYNSFDYQGIVLGSSQDISSYGSLHLDYYSTNASVLNVYLISSGGVETSYALSVPSTGWNSTDIMLSEFSPVDLNDVIQLKFDGGSGTDNIFLDNIYFWKSSDDGGGGNDDPFTLDATIDFESTGYGANWSWNVFENDTNPVLEFVANPSPSGINTSSRVARFTALQAGEPFAGTETQHGEMGIFNIDADHAIIKIMVYKTTTSDVGIKLVKPDGWSLGEIKIPNTAVNTWQELTFDFTSQIESGYDQIVVFPDFTSRTSDNVIYFDNITFGN